MNTTSDEHLLAKHLVGRPGCFELLVRRYGQELFHFLYRLLGSAATAEDIVQETFMQVHISASTFDSNRRFRPWVFAIAANKGRDYMRSQKRRPEMPLDAPAAADDHEGLSYADLLSARCDRPSLDLELAERSIVIKDIVDQLPMHLREVLILGYYHGFSYKDMAAILQIPLGTIKSRLHTAVAAFAKLHQERTKQSEETRT